MNTKEKDKRPGKRDVLSKSEVENLERVIEDHQEMTSETETHYVPEQGKGFVDKQVATAKKLLNEGQPDSHNKWERDRIEKRANEIAEILKSKLTPRRLLGLKASTDGVPNPEFWRVTEKHAKEEMSTSFNQLAMEWKNLQRELGRDSSLEILRPN